MEDILQRETVKAVLDEGRRSVNFVPLNDVETGLNQT
jgi:hypothetical protein